MELTWQSIYGPASGRSDRDALYLGSTEVARMIDRADGTWFALLRSPTRGAVARSCSSYEAGKAGCEAWVTRHRERLKRHATRKHLEWLARRSYCGDEGAEARAKLAELDARTAPE